MKMSHLRAMAALGSTLAVAQAAPAAGPSALLFNLQLSPDPSGIVATYDADGRIDPRNPFFQSLGTNGRSCATCHLASQAMSISPPDIVRRYEATQGKDPLFAAVDGANCNTVKTSDRAGHSLVLQHGLIRIALALPATAKFTISTVHDPYGCALVTDPLTGSITVSVYRRPLPSTNLNFLSTVMWDGRETLSLLTSEASFPANLQTDLLDQAKSAVLTHAQATAPPSSAQLQAIVSFELGLYSAQVWDRSAGALFLRGASGGARNLSYEIDSYYPGINDSLGADPQGHAFDPSAMSLFAAWSQAGATPGDRNEDGGAAARRAVAAGEQLFNTAPLTITAVSGLNDNAALGKPASLQGTCTTCHDAPNIGNHSLPLPLDIGIGHPTLPGFETDPNISAALAEVHAADLPVFRIDGCPDPFNPTGVAPIYTTDPGKALISGQCSDLRRLKGPILRGLAARAPYFHNGAAASLAEVVDFYDKRFNMSLSATQKADLVAFLGTL
jgi:cytochrome c peroxidase